MQAQVNTATTTQATTTRRPYTEVHRELEEIHGQEQRAFGAEMALLQMIQCLQPKRDQPGIAEALELTEQLLEQYHTLHSDLNTRWVEVFSEWA